MVGSAHPTALELLAELPSQACDSLLSPRIAVVSWQLPGADPAWPANESNWPGILEESIAWE
jgi:hypothetical protein